MSAYVTNKRNFEYAQAESPLKALVLDLRGNPGGLLSSAIKVSELFINEVRAHAVIYMYSLLHMSLHVFSVSLF